MSKRTAPEKEQYVIDHFSTETNAEISEACGVSVAVIYRIARTHGLKRSQAFRDKQFGKLSIPDDKMWWLVKNYKNTDNFTCAEELGISETSLHRIARKYGLKKTKAYMRQCQAETAAAAKYLRAKYGKNPPKGVYSENLQKGKDHQFKPGENNRMRNGAANERRRIISCTIARRNRLKSNHKSK